MSAQLTMCHLLILCIVGQPCPQPPNPATFIGLEGTTPFGTQSTKGIGVSGDGTVVVGDLANDGIRPFRWTQLGGLEDLGTLQGDPWLSAFRASYDGCTVVGSDQFLYGSIAFRWTCDGGMALISGSRFLYPRVARDLSADGSVAVGQLYNSSARRLKAMRWTADGGLASLGALGEVGGESIARAVSADGAPTLPR